MSLLAMRDLSFKYLNSTSSAPAILRNINLQVMAGEFVSIVGPSGCGKSTLLRLAAGLLAASTGSVKMSEEIKNEIGFVFQEPRLLPWLSLRENLLWGLETKRMITSNELLAKTLSMLQLSDKENLFPEQLSGGMKMRASLGRALMRDPELLLLDEPFSALDENTKLELQIELLRILTLKKRTCLLVTHSLTEAVLLSDRVLVMNSSGNFEHEFKITKAREQRFDWFRQNDFLSSVNELRELFYKAVAK